MKGLGVRVKGWDLGLRVYGLGIRGLGFRGTYLPSTCLDQGQGK